jgi:hypothetical protein
MEDIDDKLERLKAFLWKRPLAFCVAYRINMIKAGPELKWSRALTPQAESLEEYKKLAATYQEVALNSFQYGRNLILRETLPSANSRTVRWCGIVVHTGTKEDLPPANSLGQRWWHLVVASGATRDSGYAIVARVGAKHSKEVQDCIAGIQEIMSAKEA